MRDWSPHSDRRASRPSRIRSRVVRLPGLTFSGAQVDDHETLDQLPAGLRHLLAESNGFVAYDGGLHVRGACLGPVWHSLRAAWHGERAFHRHYSSIQGSDVPFAQDAVGDQWLLRDGAVIQLMTETGEIEQLGVDLPNFLAGAVRDPIDVLGLHPLMQFTNEGGRLEPGQLLSVYPPFCTEQASDGVSLRAVPADERLSFLADLARQLPADGTFQIDIEP
jgi:hypothetical protein